MVISVLFQATVSEEDGMESIAHRFLSAAIKVLKLIFVLRSFMSRHFPYWRISSTLLFNVLLLKKSFA